MDSVWMKNASVPFTYSSRRKIFLQGCPLEMWRSHARRPAATLPTRFSIKQANNTIPTPINKWSFLNKVLYTEPLTEATHHNLMGSCTGQSYSSPSSYLHLWAEWGCNGGSWNRRSRWAIIIIIVPSRGLTQVKIQHYLFHDLWGYQHALSSLLSPFLSVSLISFMHTNRKKSQKNIKTYTPAHKLLDFPSQLFSLFPEIRCSQQFEHSERWLARCLGVCQCDAIVS